MMKKYINKYVILSFIGLFLVASCDEGDAVVDDVVANTTRGAALRTIEVLSSELPIGVADAAFAVDLEIQDEEEGALVSTIDVFVAFRDNTVETGAEDLDVAEALFATISSDTFEPGPFGLPRTSFSAGLTELLAFTGVSEGDLFGGDQFQIRFELVFSDGRTFSSTNSNPGNLGGSFFSSPFLYFPTIICPVPEGAFTGTYDLSLANPGVFSGGAFTEGNVEISALNETSRSIATTNYPQFGGFARTFVFDLICGGIIVPEQDQSLECTAGTPLIYSPSETTTSYDPFDDSELTIIFDEDTQGTCGGPVTVTFSLTKV